MKTHKKSGDTINIITLGCSKNIVDSEFLVQQLSAQSLKVEHNIENSEAKTIIINTCGFILDARKESVNTILHYARLKEAGEIDRLYVMGCLAERYRNDLKKEIPEADGFFGVNDIRSVLAGMGFNYYNELTGERILSTPGHYAYLKVAEGCNRKCSFCAIPSIRGNYVSKPMDILVEETRSLAGKGVKEIILISQDLSWYGQDIYKKTALAELIEKLSEVEGIEWIRLHYMYPAAFPKEVLDVMNSGSNICHYLDIPFQHISDKILKSMRRGITSSQTWDLIHEIRNRIPGIALRTTLLTGYPGESEEDFKLLLRFVEKARFERLGAFAYSHEENTWSYQNFKDDIPAGVKHKRMESIMKIQQDISESLNRAKTGAILKVLIDRREGNAAVGRSEYDSPEIDNEVIIPEAPETLKPGDFVKVQVTEGHEFDLTAKII